MADVSDKQTSDREEKPSGIPDQLSGTESNLQSNLQELLNYVSLK